MTENPNHLAVLTRVCSDIEAASIVAALAGRGIKATATGGYTAGFRAEAPGDVSVIVGDEDLNRAKQVLAQILEDQTEIDWSKVDIGKSE